MRRSFPGAFVFPTFLLSLVLAAACSGAPSPTQTVAPSPTTNPDAIQLIIASTDLAVGSNRLAFAALDAQSETITTPDIKAVVHPARPDPPRMEVTPVFRPWPGGVAGLYSAQADFAEPGQWVLTVRVPGERGDRVSIVTFEVQEQSRTPALGQRPPASMNRTARDVDDLAKLTSDSTPDLDLYQMSVAQALESGRPSVVTFATPAFCSSRTCGPQVDVVETVKDGHKGQANFIHIEIFENPDEMQGDLSRARPALSVIEWDLPSEPWTFVLDREGKVAAKFEGFASAEELEEALEPLL